MQGPSVGVKRWKSRWISSWRCGGDTMRWWRAVPHRAVVDNTAVLCAQLATVYNRAALPCPAAPPVSCAGTNRSPVLSSSHRGRAPVLSSSHRGRRAPMLSSSMFLAPMLPGEGMGGVRLPCTCSYRQDAHPPGSVYRRQTPLLPSCYPPVWEAISRLPGSGVGARGCLVCPDSRRRSV